MRNEAEESPPSSLVPRSSFLVPASLEESAALADHLRQARDYPAAIEMLKGALVKAPSSAWLHWELSQALQDDGQVDAARAERDLARKANPRLIAAELSYLEDKEQALRAPERIQRLKALRQTSPQSSQIEWALAKAYDEAGLKAEALQAARAAVASAGGPEEIARLAAFYQEHDRDAAAASLLTGALRSAPNDEALLEEQARLSEDKGKAIAIAQCQRVLQIDPSAWWYRRSSTRRRGT
jgi:tetratricopeptide (TPR) repeat protein